jgi:hypothetical protein
MSRRSPWRPDLRVAKYASPDESERYTVSCLDLSITFTIVETLNGGPLKGRRTPIGFGARPQTAPRPSRAFGELSAPRS